MVFVGIWAGAFGCSRKQPSDPVLSYLSLLQATQAINDIARLDTPPTYLISSYDRKGGNNDYNQFEAKGPPGWVVLADLKGPGYVSRFWFTGAKTGKHLLRFYFDGETTPSMEVSLKDWFGGTEPITSPLAAYENYCWYSYLPIPYKEQLVIMAQEGGTEPGGWPRLFYQVNFSRSPPGTSVESFPRPLLEEHKQAIVDLRKTWGFAPANIRLSNTTIKEHTLRVDPGKSSTYTLAQGPSVIERLTLTVTFPNDTPVVEKETWIQNTWLHVRWDQGSAPSVQAPLAHFFGSFWQRNRFSTLYYGLKEDTFYSTFPMPYQEQATFTFVSKSSLPASVQITIAARPQQSDEKNLGYFHAFWNTSSYKETGLPHTLLRAKGMGKYVGCILSSSSASPSWWLLEGDEAIRIDSDREPFWRGTGLEDYFNGGWYYQNVLSRPLHGLVMKAPFRTVQYRTHLTDAVPFKQSLDMLVERGPENASPGDFVSVAFYYGKEPYPSKPTPRARANTFAQDKYWTQTLMTRLCNFERFNDLQGASDCIDLFLHKTPDFPFKPQLMLRKLAYQEEAEGFDSVERLYHEFLTANEHNRSAQDQARDLLWFHESRDNALLFFYSNTKSEIYLDGVKIAEGTDPQKMLCNRIQVTPGPHVLVVKAEKHTYPDWVQVCLRTHTKDILTTPQWIYSFSEPTSLKTWERSHDQFNITHTGVKGPPEVPYIWVEPNAYVFTQSKAIGLRPSEDWPNQARFVYYRTEFSL